VILHLVLYFYNITYFTEIYNKMIIPQDINGVEVNLENSKKDVLGLLKHILPHKMN